MASWRLGELNVFITILDAFRMWSNGFCMDSLLFSDCIRILRDLKKGRRRSCHIPWVIVFSLLNRKTKNRSELLNSRISSRTFMTDLMHAHFLEISLMCVSSTRSLPKSFKKVAKLKFFLNCEVSI